MITVSIFINGNPIITRSARNQKRTHKEKGARYRCDDGSMLWHKREDGAIALAKKMLDTVKEF